ncbi:hypothetical protein AB0M36_05905 [Actinoplanes sp. NPDC051346]|uniref:hypothetical protein n=1 Tax=Actinoplanes sp. NPDC051346 TaxID=3155048 RepID=UPI003436B6B9
MKSAAALPIVVPMYNKKLVISKLAVLLLSAVQLICLGLLGQSPRKRETAAAR